MKSIIALALLVTSVSSFSFEKNAVMDLTNVYGNNNAGLYEVVVNFTPKTTLSASLLSTKTVYDDGQSYCTTSAQFDIGEMSVLLINRKAGWTKNIVKKLTATLSHKSANATCETDLENFVGDKDIYAALGVDSIILPAKAPLNYNSVLAHVAPFSGFLALKTNIEIQNNKLVINPAELLTESVVMESNTVNANMTYFVLAKNETSSLSLANGIVPLE